MVDLVWPAGAGLAIGAGMGLYAMIRPGWAAWLVRLNPDTGRPGGFGEFRATYGGLFFFTHALALVCLVLLATSPEGGQAPLPEAAVLGMCAIGAAMWWGTAVGRILSLIADRQGIGFNAASIVFEAIMGALIASPIASALFAGSA
jgi:hypothetical protein